MAKVSRKRAVNPLCMLEGRDDVWLDLANLVQGPSDCWEEEMRLHVNASASISTGKQIGSEPNGVRIHTVKYGDPRASLVEFDGKSPFAGVLHELYNFGYSDNQNLFAAPFDWRRGPGHWIANDWKKLKSFVEQTVQKAGGTPAVFISASFGGSYFASFLQHAPGLDADWKQRNVGSLVALSSPFSGASAMLSALLWGDASAAVGALGGGPDVGGAQLSLSKASMKSLVNTWGTAFWLLPESLDEPLIVLPPSWGGHLTLGRLRDLWAATGRADAVALFDIGRRYQATAHPGVKVYCVFGEGAASPGSYGYDQGADAAPAAGAAVGDMAWLRSAAALLEERGPDAMETVPGDGLADNWSLAACERWAEEAPELPPPTVLRIQLTHPGHGLGLSEKGALKQLGPLLHEAIREGPRDMKSEINAGKLAAHALTGKESTHDKRSLPKKPDFKAGTVEKTAPQILTCSDKLPGAGFCPTLAHNSDCGADAAIGQLTRGSTCCSQLITLEQCMGSDCFPAFVKKLLVNYLRKAVPNADIAASASYFAAWTSSCGGGAFPSVAELLAFSRDVTSSSSRSVAHIAEGANLESQDIARESTGLGDTPERKSVGDSTATPALELVPSTAEINDFGEWSAIAAAVGIFALLAAASARSVLAKASSSTTDTAKDWISQPRHVCPSATGNFQQTLLA